MIACVPLLFVADGGELRCSTFAELQGLLVRAAMEIAGQEQDAAVRSSTEEAEALIAKALEICSTTCWSIGKHDLSGR